MNQHTWDSIVIGGGAAGLSAAQALGRSLRRTLVIDAGRPRNRFASHMHNVLGLDGIPPAELIARGRAEAERYGVEFRAGSVRTVCDLAVEGSGPRLLRVELEDGEVLDTRSLVVATGVTDELPPIPGLAERWGGRVLHCPYCHGWEVRGQRIAVLTASPLGLHQARLLRQWSEHLTVFTAGLGELGHEPRREFEARGVRLVPEPVTEIVDGDIGEAGGGIGGDGIDGNVTGDDDRTVAVRTATGEFAVDAIFTTAEPVPHDGFLRDLALDRAETPMGSFIAVDPMGRTSHPRIWAAGNVVNPVASVPMVMGGGTLAGAAANGALAEEDFALAAGGDDSETADPFAAPRHPPRTRQRRGSGPDGAIQPEPDEDPAAFWERRYAGADAVWSGRVNRALADAVAHWVPGRSLDLGCGEGGDVLWLAERGWEATGIDLSETAIARARETAAARGIATARFIAADLGRWALDPARFEGSAAGSGRETAGFDLVTASFLQSPVELPRERILRAAAEQVAMGGHLVVISHAAPPPWAHEHEHEQDHERARPRGRGQDRRGSHASPADEIALLGLDSDRWSVDAGVRRRPAIAPDGSECELEDTVVVARRLR